MMCDQLRSDMLSYAGNKAIKTPNIDYIAEKGFNFKNHYTSLPSCTPARATILTGQKAWNHGMLGAGSIATKYPYEMPAAMSDEAKYYTYSIGKDHFGWNTTTNKGISHGY